MPNMVYLDTKASAKINQRFTQKSIVKGRFTQSEDFVGAKTVRLHNIHTVPLNDYNRSASANRYGTPKEVPDTVQELTMSQDKSFTGLIDKGNTMDQSINKAGKFVRVEMDEEVIPAYDKYCLSRLAMLAGKIAGSAEAISSTNVLARCAAARKALFQARASMKESTWYVTSDVYNALIDSKPFQTLEKIGKEAVCDGHVGYLYGAAVVEAQDDLMPASVNFILANKRSATAPEKIHDCKTHIDPPGVSGVQVDGRFYYDLFVYGPKAGGVYMDVQTGSGKATVSAEPTIAAATGVITAASGHTAYYTTDGSDPRYSASVKAGTTPTVQSGDVVKAYQTKDGQYPSGVVSVTIT